MSAAIVWPRTILLSLCDELHNEQHTNTAQLRGCSDDIVASLRLAVQRSFVESARNESLASLSGLIDLANETLKKNACQKDAQTTCWRRLYTDASICLALAELTFSHPPDPLQSISRLDRAIIIAGAAGERRLELVQQLITNIQADYFTSNLIDIITPSFTLPLKPPPNSLSDLAHHEVPCLHPNPSMVSFRSEYSERPFVLRGFAMDQGWPALHERPWGSVEYLTSIAGPGRTVPVEIGKDYRTHDWTQALMSWQEFLARINHPEPEILYLAQHNLIAQFPSLRDDLVVPDYVYSCPSPPKHFPEYAPPRNEDELVLNFWLGPKGTISPAHTDPFFNVYIQVVGFKTVWLAPPEVSSSMSAFPSLDTSNHPAANTTNPMMANTSQLDVFSPGSCPVDVVNQAYAITLGPGDLLFFPPGWWHGMRSESTSFSVSMWF